ncbi:MAG: hypothetical protein EA397_17445 [Deltaproteobacteria bacterium]|nr:MAG: hypothetical protein EA397_17445 [Deltaproteobacteria bacterium]
MNRVSRLPVALSATFSLAVLLACGGLGGEPPDVGERSPPKTQTVHGTGTSDESLPPFNVDQAMLPAPDRPRLLLPDAWVPVVLDTQGRLRCMSDDQRSKDPLGPRHETQNGECPYPKELLEGPYTSVEALSAHVMQPISTPLLCGLRRDGVLICGDDEGARAVTTTRFASFSLAGLRSGARLEPVVCGREADGGRSCIGWPADLDGPEEGIDQIRLGEGYACGLRGVELTCWGAVPGWWELPREGLTELATLGQCGLTAKGELRCVDRDLPVPPGSPFREIHVAEIDGQPQGVCGLLKSGELRCRRWAHLLHAEPSLPVDIPSGPFVSAALSRYRVCGLTASEEVRCGTSLQLDLLGQNMEFDAEVHHAE